MASIYDYGNMGIPEAAQGLTNLYNAFSQDAVRKEQINNERIMQQKAMFELDKMRKQEELNDKDVMFASMLEAKGASPRVIDRYKKYAQMMGVGDEIGRVKYRNIPQLVKTMNDDKAFQMEVHQDYFDELGEGIAQLDQDIMKMREKPDFQQDEKYLGLVRQKGQLQAKQLQHKRMIDNLAGIKQDTSRTKDEILTGDPNSEDVKNYITNTNKIEVNKSDKMQSDIGKLQADKEYYLKQGFTADSPLIKSFDDEMRKKSQSTVDSKIEKERLAAVGRNDRLDFELDRLETAATNLLNHPGRKIGTGKSAVFNVVPGTPGYDFKVAANQLGNMLQLDTMTAMREASKTGGLMGNLSDKEGQVLRGYVAELDTLQSEKQYEDWINKVLKYTKDLRLKSKETLEKQFPIEGMTNGSSTGVSKEEAMAELRRRGKIK
jgi:hypothetical protein